LEIDLSELSQVLALTKSENQQLQFGIESLENQLSASIDAREQLQAQLAQLRSEYVDAQAQISTLTARSAADKEALDRQLSEIADLSGDVAALRALKEELEKEVTSLSLAAQNIAVERDQLAESLATAEADRENLKTGLAEQSEIAESARAQLALMNKQMAALRQQLNALNAALEASEAEAEKKDVQIEALGQRLNAALAGKVQELARYRSEFFGRLREVIGNRNDVRIVGDRFVLQSELLFAKSKAEIGEAGKRELAKLATTLLDGHTDSDPIATPQFPSNWELSTARALSVVHALVDAGIPAKRLAATGFGEYYPLTASQTEAAKAKNRRIEFKFTQR
jgi:chemotaxis protein MotB